MTNLKFKESWTLNIGDLKFYWKLETCTGLTRSTHIVRAK